MGRIKRLKKTRSSLFKFLKNRKSVSVALGVCLAVVASAYVATAKFSADSTKQTEIKIALNNFPKNKKIQSDLKALNGNTPYRCSAFTVYLKGAPAGKSNSWLVNKYKSRITQMFISQNRSLINRYESSFGKEVKKCLQNKSSDCLSKINSTVMVTSSKEGCSGGTSIAYENIQIPEALKIDTALPVQKGGATTLKSSISSFNKKSAIVTVSGLKPFSFVEYWKNINSKAVLCKTGNSTSCTGTMQKPQGSILSNPAIQVASPDSKVRVTQNWVSIVKEGEITIPADPSSSTTGSVSNGSDKSKTIKLQVVLAKRLTDNINPKYITNKVLNIIYDPLGDEDTNVLPFCDIKLTYSSTNKTPAYECSKEIVQAKGWENKVKNITVKLSSKMDLRLEDDKRLLCTSPSINWSGSSTEQTVKMTCDITW